MPLAELDLPPGVYRNGTALQSRGRYYDSQLVRWFEGYLSPVGGWVAHSASAVSGAARSVVTWIDNSIGRWIGIGTHTHLYVMGRTGVLSDITPVGFTAGRADATTAGGFGTGAFGVGSFGTPRPDTGLVQDATMWSQDIWDGQLVGCNAEDGKAYIWDLNVAHKATAITNAPVGNRALMVTDESFIVLLGAASNPRLVQWCDQGDETVWTPDATNQARFYPLQTIGRIMCGRKTRGAFLVFTDLDVHRGVYVGTPDVYDFERLAEGCGIVSQGAAVPAGDKVAWMGSGGFWLYNGYVQPLPCEVQDYVFSDFNRVQQSKVYAKHNAKFGEIEWYYCSGGSNEIDSYVRWNYREPGLSGQGHWAVGKLARTAGVDAGAFRYPIMVDPAGIVWQHENGFNYSSLAPYAETGPFEWPDDAGIGDRVVTATKLIPDEKAQGDVNATFYGRFAPNDADETFGPYTMADQVDVLFTARIVRARFTGVTLADWRIGRFQLDVTPRGKQ